MEEKYLAPKDAAEILSVKKTTVYDMIRRGQLKAVKVGKQFRIRQADVLALMDGSQSAAEEEVDPLRHRRAEITLCGQDMLLDNLCARVNAAAGFQAVRRSYLGSYNGLFALYQGQANLATAHLWDRETDTYNLPFVSKMLPGMEVQVYHIVNRQIGIYTAPGNPKNIRAIDDFARADVRMVNREKGSGIRVLTDSLFLQRGIDVSRVQGYAHVEQSHMAAAAAVGRGEADCAFGNARSVLGSHQVEFLPVRFEQYDLIVPAAELEHPTVRQVLTVLRSEAMRLETEALGGYDTRNMGARLL